MVNNWDDPPSKSPKILCFFPRNSLKILLKRKHQVIVGLQKGVVPTTDAKRNRVGGTRYYDLAMQCPEVKDYVRWVLWRGSFFFPLEYQCMKFGFVSYNDPLFFWREDWRCWSYLMTYQDVFTPQNGFFLRSFLHKMFAFPAW